MSTRLATLLDNPRATVLARKLDQNKTNMWRWMHGRIKIPRDVAEAITKLPEYSGLTVRDIMSANALDNLEYRDIHIPKDDVLNLNYIKRNINPGLCPEIPLSQRLLRMAKDLQEVGL